MTTETIEQSVTTIAQVTSPLDSVFNALVKAVADKIMAQVLESTELESKISMTMDLLLEDKLDVEGEIEHWMRNNFDIGDYSDDIQNMICVNEAEVKDIIRGMEFTVSVD
jgi:hypothetical protein